MDERVIAYLAAVTYFDSTHGKIYFDETIEDTTKHATLSPVSALA